MAAVVFASPATAFADDDDDDESNTAKKAGDLAGWEYDNAPAATHVAIYTQLLGTKEQFTGIDTDTILGVATAIGEFAPVEQLSVFGEISYRYLASGQNQSTGWEDPIIGAKVVPFMAENFAFAAYIKGNIPLSADKVSIRDYEATNLGLAVSFAPIQLIGFNLSADFGRVWKLDISDTEAVKAVEFNFKAELVFMPPIVVTGRIGLTGVFRDQGIDKSMFQFYAEVSALGMIFVRVSFPLDIDSGIEGIQQGFETGEWLVTAGVWFPIL